MGYRRREGPSCGPWCDERTKQLRRYWRVGIARRSFFLLYERGFRLQQRAEPRGQGSQIINDKRVFHRVTVGYVTLVILDNKSTDFISKLLRNSVSHPSKFTQSHIFIHITTQKLGILMVQLNLDINLHH
jgi:hypothetical protein